MQDSRVKSLIEELDLFVPRKNKHQIVEARATNVIASAVNLINLISESFSDHEAGELQRRLLSAIKNNDPAKFNRKIREYHKLEENRRGK